MNEMQSKPLMVTTAHRGVFFGYGVVPPKGETNITLTTARMCVKWSSDMRGVFGLAAQGPSKMCRIGPAVPSLHLLDVTSVTEVSDSAAKAWESAPWE